MRQTKSQSCSIQDSINAGFDRLMDLCEARRSNGENVSQEAALLNQLAADVFALTDK